MRIFQVLKELARFHNMYLISFVRNPNDLQYKQNLLEYCKDAKLVLLPESLPGNYFSMYRSAQFQKHIDEFLASYPIDLIQIEHSYMDVYRYNMKKPGGIKKVLVQHNIEYEVYKQRLDYGWHGFRFKEKLLNYYDYLRFRKFELNTMKNQDLCVMMSELERNKIIIKAPRLSQRMIVVPNGTNIDYFQPPSDGRDRDTLTLVFTAHMGWFPNEDGVLWFYREVFPLLTDKYPDLKVVVAGREPTDQIIQIGNEDRRMIVTGRVNNIREFLYSGTVFICPLRMGGGTRLKILEAMASGIPVVSTSVGCEGIDVTDGENIMIADKPEQFAENILLLLEQPILREKLSRNARLLVEKNYSWKTIVDAYNKQLWKLYNRESD